jgi:hypothetical protein
VLSIKKPHHVVILSIFKKPLDIWGCKKYKLGIKTIQNELDSASMEAGLFSLEE